MVAACQRMMIKKTNAKRNLDASCNMFPRPRRSVKSSIVLAVAATEYDIISSQKNGKDEAPNQAIHPATGVVAVGPRAEKASPVSQMIKVSQPSPTPGTTLTKT